MRRFKVLLVYPNFPMSHMLLPAGVSILSAVLKQAGIEVGLFDTTLYRDGGRTLDEIRTSMLQLKANNLGTFVPQCADDPQADFEALLDRFQPDLVGLSVLQDTFPLGLPFAKQARARGVPVIAGGIFPTFNPEAVIAEDAIDMLCVGEGENALVALCQAMRAGEPIDGIANLWVKRADGSIVRNPVGPLVNVNELPFSDYSIFALERFYRPMQGRVMRMIPVEMHRGCPYQCTFCEDPSQNKLYQKAGVARTYHRSKSPERLIDEIKFFVDTHEANYIYFNAETFFAMPGSDFVTLADLYARDIGLPFWLQTRPETITEERVALLKRMNVANINIGLEHGNEEYRCRVLKRCMKNSRIIAGLRILNEAGIPVTVNNIMGFPDETRELVFDTIELNRQIQSATINAYLYNPYKGTELYEVCRSKGYIAEDDDGKVIDQALSTEAFAYFKTCLRMPTITPEELIGLQRTFVLYVKLPRDEYPRIHVAERDDDEGEAMFTQLCREYAHLVGAAPGA